jgi:pimeloyl-ACP methyl ester carboxylesterase
VRVSATAAIPRPATVEGRRIEAVELPGDPARRPLVLLHEGLGSVGLWRGFPAALNEATGRRVLAFSRFGHGRSEPPPRPRTPAFFHEEALDVLPALLPQLDAAEPILVGHSDGGSIALVHAAYHPVAGVALLAPHVFVEDFTVEEIRRTRGLYETGGLRERMARHHDDPDAAFRGWADVWLDPAFREWTIESDAQGVTAPALLIQGDGDPYGTLEQIDRIHARVRGPVERLVVAGAGHSPQFEAPEPVLTAIRDFVARLP